MPSRPYNLLRRQTEPERAPIHNPNRTINFDDSPRPSLHSPRRSFLRDVPITITRSRTRPDADLDDEEDDDEEEDSEGLDNEDNDENESLSNVGIEEQAPLLPIFAAGYLDTLPLFLLTHTVRTLVIEKCDTVLTWEQLRSPQVSQFLVKPIQQTVREDHFNAATECALLANCLQFTKEADASPGNSGTNRTRAMLCELVAIKLLKEHAERDLIDSLSYDFDPLQGQPQELQHNNGQYYGRRTPSRPARISCIEIALRASAKRFLSHPLVVQHLEAIWNGSLVFQAAADSMHRSHTTVDTPGHPRRTGPRGVRSGMLQAQRSAMLYNSKDASLFKLSRLRVPRYRNILSTISFAILLVLFLYVLKARTLEITALEIVFWVWAAGYMLDEVIGFNEQGFSLYIASFWNTFDIGILILLFIHLCLRLYGMLMPTGREKRLMADNAYDVLAASAILLFPRLFSVLDHYRYFSQLIIAFRMMAVDLLAVFVLIIIFCSGFLVSLTFAFGREGVDDPSSVAYALLQMMLGFTPAAWDRWADYTWLGKAVLVIFLLVCHFVVVTILITVLTNSFLAIVKNANEEHQFLFAVNTISNVKSDALFAYIPPTNVLQWLCTPLRYILPFKQYIRVNRTIIKATHFPILFTIYFYERFILQSTVPDTSEMSQQHRGRLRRSIARRMPRLVREPSIATFRQEAALEEVFKAPLDTTYRTVQSRDRKASNVVHKWMAQEEAETPLEQDRRTVDRLERQRRRISRFDSSRSRISAFRDRPTSTTSDPQDLASHLDIFSPGLAARNAAQRTPSIVDIPIQQTDADGDDEDDNDEDADTPVLHKSPFDIPQEQSNIQDYFSSKGHIPQLEESSDSTQPPVQQQPRDNRQRPHMRAVSSATMIFNPPDKTEEEGSATNTIPNKPSTRSKISAGAQTPSVKHSAGRKTPRQIPGTPGRARPGLQGLNTQAFRSTPNIQSTLAQSQHSRPMPIGSPVRRQKHDHQKSADMDLVSDIGDDKAIGGGYVGALPASFASKMNFAHQAQRELARQNKQQETTRQTEEAEMFGRLIMARMNSLEEGFRDVVHEMRESMRQVGSGGVSRNRSPEPPQARYMPRTKNFRDRMERSAGTSSSIPTSLGRSRPGSADGPDTTTSDKEPIRPTTAIRSQASGSDIDRREDSKRELELKKAAVASVGDTTTRPPEEPTDNS